MFPVLSLCSRPQASCLGLRWRRRSCPEERHIRNMVQDASIPRSGSSSRLCNLAKECGDSTSRPQITASRHPMLRSTDIHQIPPSQRSHVQALKRQADYYSSKKSPRWHLFCTGRESPKLLRSTSARAARKREKINSSLDG